MNFKPTLWKSILSVLLGILMNYLLAGTTRVICTMIEGGTCPQPTWLEHAFDPVLLGISIITIFLVYVVWSLIQKK
jgi:hypothetical protein